LEAGSNLGSGQHLADGRQVEKEHFRFFGIIVPAAPTNDTIYLCPVYDA